MCNKGRPIGAGHRRAWRLPRGFTLPEALLAIVVLAVGLSGVMLAFASVARNSGDPVLRLQLLAVAEGMLEEIQLKPFAAAANTAPAGCARDSFNDVADYNGYSSAGICSIDGTAIDTLANFNVSVSVATATLDGVAGALRIQVTASHAGETLQLVGWRTNYGAP